MLDRNPLALFEPLTRNRWQCLASPVITHFSHFISPASSLSLFSSSVSSIKSLDLCTAIFSSAKVYSGPCSSIVFSHSSEAKRQIRSPLCSQELLDVKAGSRTSSQLCREQRHITNTVKYCLSRYFLEARLSEPFLGTFSDECLWCFGDIRLSRVHWHDCVVLDQSWFCHRSMCPIQPYEHHLRSRLLFWFHAFDPDDGAGDNLASRV